MPQHNKQPTKKKKKRRGFSNSSPPCAYNARSRLARFGTPDPTLSRSSNLEAHIKFVSIGQPTLGKVTAKHAWSNLRVRKSGRIEEVRFDVNPRLNVNNKGIKHPSSVQATFDNVHEHCRCWRLVSKHPQKVGGNGKLSQWLIFIQTARHKFAVPWHWIGAASPRKSNYLSG